MNALDKLANQLRELAEPWPQASKVYQAIERAARRSGLSVTRTSDIWYGKARSLRQFEIDQVEKALDRKRTEEARNELSELRSRLARIETLLAQEDARTHRPRADALGLALRRSR